MEKIKNQVVRFRPMSWSKFILKFKRPCKRKYNEIVIKRNSAGEHYFNDGFTVYRLPWLDK